MHKGIYPVGFPNLNDIKPALREEYEQGISSDAKGLKHLVLDSPHLTLHRQILNRKPIFMQVSAYEKQRARGKERPWWEIVCVLF